MSPWGGDGQVDESPVEAVGLGCFSRLPGSYRRAAAFDKRRALVAAVLVVFELLDLAEWWEPAVPDCLHKQEGAVDGLTCYAVLCYATLHYAVLKLPIWHGAEL